MIILENEASLRGEGCACPPENLQLWEVAKHQDEIYMEHTYEKWYARRCVLQKRHKRDNQHRHSEVRQTCQKKYIESPTWIK